MELLALNLILKMTVHGGKLSTLCLAAYLSTYVQSPV